MDHGRLIWAILVQIKRFFFSRADRHWSCAVVKLHNVNCQQPFSICNKWFPLVGLIVGGSHAKVGGTRNQIASITVLHPCPLAQLTGKILNDRHQSRNTKKAMVAETNKHHPQCFMCWRVQTNWPRRLIRPWNLEPWGEKDREKLDGEGTILQKEKLIRGAGWGRKKTFAGGKYFAGEGEWKRKSWQTCWLNVCNAMSRSVVPLQCLLL